MISVGLRTIGWNMKSFSIDRQCLSCMGSVTRARLSCLSGVAQFAKISFVLTNYMI